MLTKIMEMFGKLPEKTRKTIITSFVTVIITGSGGTGYVVFAKASVVKAQALIVSTHLAKHEKEDDMKRIRILEELMLEYRELLGDDLEKATLKQKKRYKMWDIELELLYKKYGV